jgi:peptidoglycan/xylan/chitin deacetylase (PgdA/CDA1 family)
MSKGKILRGLVAGLVVVVLLAGIFSIAKRLTGSTTADQPKKQESGKTVKNSGKSTKKGKADEDTEAADNSKPMTSLTVKAPQTYIREGDTMKLKVVYEPADATNTKLKWSCSEKGLVDVSEDGTLTPAEGSGKNTVTVTAEATDGSDLKQSCELRIYPAIDPTKPMIAITFDDGPNPSTTNAMLDALEENYARATFFCLGNHAEDYPDVVKREYELGMEVGTHTYAHKNIAAESEGVIDEEISKGVKSIEKAIGVKPTLMRPPYGGYASNGKVDPRILATAKEYGLCCINWSVDTLDWKGKDPDFTYQAVMKAGDGDIVLLHDIHSYNVKAVERFVPDLIEEGYQLVTVTELYETFHELNKGYYDDKKNDLDLLKPGTIHNSPWPRAKDEDKVESTDDEGSSNTEKKSEKKSSNSSSDSEESGTIDFDSLD